MAESIIRTPHITLSPYFLTEEEPKDNNLKSQLEVIRTPYE
jgi:hypothetical protein